MNNLSPFQVRFFSDVTSTNEVARDIISGGGEEGTIVVAEYQSRGRGRRGRRWDSRRGLGLWATLILRPPLEGSQMFSLGAAVSVAIAKAVESLFGIEPSIQWPNDVYLTGRKFGGILVETGREEGWGRYALVGMGINLNHERRDFPPHLRRMATSLREESGREMKVPVFLEGLITFLRKELASVYEKGFDGIRADYVRRSSLLHRRVRIKLAAEEIEAVVVDFGRCGEVVVRADGTGDRTLNYGEVVRVWR